MGVETTERKGREEESDGKNRKEESVGRIGFLVRALNSSWEQRDEDDDSGSTYKRAEFHMLDLNTDNDMLELRRDVLPPLLGRTGGGVLLSLAPSSISVFGGLSPSLDESLVSLKPPPERRHLYYKGAATINLHQPPPKVDHHHHRGGDGDGEVCKCKWQPFPLQFRKYNAFLPVCAVLSDKLYNFGSISLAPEVFDPSLGYWKRLRLPSHVSCTEPSYPVLADPSNHRILIHFHCHSHLYAFYPSDPHPVSEDSDSDTVPVPVPRPGGRWERLKPDYFPWANVVAVADDLLFLYEFDSFLVFDLASGDRLDVVWSSSMCGNVMVTNIEFTSLFSLGNGFMCFAHSISEPPPDNIAIVFLFIVRAHRSVDSTSIILTPISFHYKTIESTYRVLDVLPLSQEASEILGGKLA